MVLRGLIMNLTQFKIVKTVVHYRRPLWRYPLFQIPLMFLSACLVLAALFWALGLSQPKVAVAIAIDLNPSTYQPQPFNAPNTIMAEEVEAVRAYLKQNTQFLRQPNQIQIFGYAGAVQPLTNGFQTDSKQLQSQLDQALQDQTLPQRLSTTTDINQTIQQTTSILSSISDRCRELLLVSSSDTPVSPDAIADAVAHQVKINALVVRGSTALQSAALATHGIYLTTQEHNLETLFIDRFLIRFNSNLKWILSWLGAAWIALMWLLILPLDRWIYQDLLKLSMSLAGRLALSNALFWSILIPILLWRLSSLPLIFLC